MGCYQFRQCCANCKQWDKLGPYLNNLICEELVDIVPMGKCLKGYELYTTEQHWCKEWEGEGE